MFVELEGISEANAVVVLIVLWLHNIMEHRFDIHISNIVCQQHNLIAMNLVLILAQHILLLNQSALQQASDKGSCACKWVEDMNIFVSQRGIELALQNVFYAVNDEVHTFHRCIDNA